MSGLNPKYPSLENQRPRDPCCLATSDVPVLCVQFESARQRVAIPYALLLRVELSEDETACDIHFGTHDVRLRGHRLRNVFAAVASGHAHKIGLGDLRGVGASEIVLGPLILKVEIEAVEENMRSRR